jgi:hypothetical protein
MSSISRWCWYVVWGLALICRVSADEGAGEISRPLEIKTYRGWPECLVLNAGRVKLIVAPAVGGRALFYGFNGENMIFENPATFGKTLDNSIEDLWFGGYQCDIGPELRGIPPHKIVWQGRHEWVARRGAVKTISPADPALGAQLEKEFFIAPDNGDVGLTQRLINTSSQEITFCLWDRTLCVGGGYALVPLNKKSRFKNGWSLYMKGEPGKGDGKDHFDGSQPAPPGVQVLNGVLVAKAEGPATKLGADTDAGWIAYVKGSLMFIKYFPVSAKANYSDGGNSVELYFNEKVAELEPLSPEFTLKPGEKYDFPEKWTLIELSDEIRSYEKARDLVKLIPPSPFAR